MTDFETRKRMKMTEISRTEIFDRIVAELKSVIGEDILLQDELSPETSFSDDLALESVEFVALGGRLQSAFGDKVNFAEFIADLDLDAIMNLTVGDVVSYLHTRLNRG